MHIYVGNIVAVKPNLIRISVHIDLEGSEAPVSTVSNEIVLNTVDFITQQDIDGAVNFHLDVDKFKQLVTDESFRMLTTSYTAAVLAEQSLDWEIVQQVVENKDNDALKLAYGEEK